VRAVLTIAYIYISSDPLSVHPDNAFHQAFAGYIPVSSFRPQMDSVDNSLDLPTGWNTTTSSRNARYDPIIVTVFAIILACGITGAIAASVWRQQLNTRRFRVDLERATKPKRRRTTDEVDSVDSDATVEEDKPRTKKKRRRKNAAGSGGGAVTPGAGKPSSTFWRPSPRFVGRLRFRSRRHKPAEVPATEPPIVSSRPASPQPDLPPREDLTNPPIIHVTAEEDSPSHVHSRHPSHIDLTLSTTNTEDANPNNSETQPEPERIPANSVSTGLLLPVSPIHLNHSLDQSQSMQDVGDDTALRRAPTFEGYTSNPPAYLRIGTSCTSRQTEKAPLPGLEAEYDERDLGRWRASRLAASSSSSRPRPRSIAPSAIEPELDTPPPPSLNRVHGVHIATDDKTALARLHSFADQPDAPVPPAEALSISGSPTVPAFGVVEDWYTETQLEQVSSLDQSSSQALPAPVLNPLTFPPPPEPYLLSRRHGSLVHDRSYHDTQDMNEAYTFRRVWGGTTSSIGPSAPPMEIEEGSSSRRVGQDESLEGLVPSAPPLPGDPISGAHIPSAPALWDEENETYEPARDSAPPLEASRELPLGDQLSGSASDNSRGGADAHSDVRVQWVQQRQVEMEGMGLPKYEP